MNDFLTTPIRVTTHAGDDDLLTAGLGLARLRAATPPVFADADQPTPAEVRRRAIWTNWRGIADLAAGGGYGDLYGSLLPPVPGREFQAYAKLPGAKQPHRVLAQVPDNFDRKRRCVVVAASSGSRGIYGAIALAGGWGLTHGCAVAYTDKGNGSGYADADSQSGVQLDGIRGPLDGGAEFTPALAGVPAHTVAVKHAHSGDNPEAGWGKHVLQAARFSLQALDQAWPADAPFTFANTRVIVLGVSNGAGAALQAAAIDARHELAGVVAVSPNVYAENTRSLYDYATEAALYQPCALLHPTFDHVAFARPKGAKPPAWVARCQSLHDHGLVAAIDTTAQANEVYEHMRAHGWSDAAIEAGAISSSFDLWRAVAVTYASAYAGSGAGDMPCGYRFAALDTGGVPRASTVAERAAWAADGSGIPPTPGVGIVDTLAAGTDPALPGLLCLRGLFDGSEATAKRVQAGITATRTAPPRAGLPVIVIHGADDGLIPEAFTSAAYVKAAHAHDAARDLRYWRVANAQHFDAFLGLPALGARYLPLMPYAYHAMDAMLAHLTQGTALPSSAEITTQPRGLVGATAPALTASHLGTLPK